MGNQNSRVFHCEANSRLSTESVVLYAITGITTGCYKGIVSDQLISSDDPSREPHGFSSNSCYSCNSIGKATLPVAILQLQ